MTHSDFFYNKFIDQVADYPRIGFDRSMIYITFGHCLCCGHPFGIKYDMRNSIVRCACFDKDHNYDQYKCMIDCKKNGTYNCPLNDEHYNILKKHQESVLKSVIESLFNLHGFVIIQVFGSGYSEVINYVNKVIRTFVNGNIRFELNYFYPREICIEIRVRTIWDILIVNMWSQFIIKRIRPFFDDRYGLIFMMRLLTNHKLLRPLLRLKRLWLIFSVGCGLVYTKQEDFNLLKWATKYLRSV